ncbi:MAG: glycosyltransferase [Bryobacteraceae bacterium]
MKVLHVIPSLGPLRGGPSFVLPLLAEHLASRGVEVHVAATDDNGPERLQVPLESEVGKSGVHYWYFPRQLRPYTASLPLGRWLRRMAGQFSVVHLHALFSYSTTAAAHAASAAGVPYIVRPLGILNRWGMLHRRPFLKQLSFRLLERRILERAAVIQYTSAQEQVEAEQLGFRARGVVIPNPVETCSREAKAQAGTFRERYPQLEGKVVLLFLSRIDQKKGLDLLIPAFAQLRRTVPDAELVIAGSGSSEMDTWLTRIVEQHRVAGHVLRAGFLEGERKWEALSDSDVFVLPSYSENFGVAAVEAMSAGLPLVISDQVGIHPDVSRAHAGLVTPCNAESLASALAAVCTNAGMRREMSQRAAALARETYSARAVAAKMLDLYDSVVPA